MNYKNQNEIVSDFTKGFKWKKFDGRIWNSKLFETDRLHEPDANVYWLRELDKNVCNYLNN